MPSALRVLPALRPRRVRALVLFVVPLVVAVLAAALPATAGAAPTPSYQPPVDAPVSDPFRAPSSPYGPGNRGLEYDTAPGTEVRAAADGRVTFAGSVAGARHVTVLHADGLRTTASYLTTVAVVIGQEVAQGDVLGTTEGRLHFSARSGDAYLDPASLFVEGPPRVWLVPFDRPPGLGLQGERSAIRQLLGLGSGVLHLAGRAVDGGGELLRMAAHHAPLGVQPLQAAGLVVATVEVLVAAWEESQRPCTADGVAVAPPTERRAVVLVGGLGSTSEHASVDDVDVATLGYDAADVVRFSYAGGRTPRSTGHPAGVASRRYSAADSQQDLYESGRRLADLVERVAGANPGIPVDVIAHSQGGVVARLALVELQRRGSAGTVGLLATLGTPHEGADLATAARAVGFVPGGSELLEVVAVSAGSEIDPSSPSVAQLSETSDLMAELGRTPLPDGLAAVSIAARTDPIVPVPRTRLEGATPVIVPTASAKAHSDLPGDPRTTRELALALAGAPPGCRDAVEALLDQVAGRVIGTLEG